MKPGGGIQTDSKGLKTKGDLAQILSSKALEARALMSEGSSKRERLALFSLMCCIQALIALDDAYTHLSGQISTHFTESNVGVFQKNPQKHTQK